MFDSLQTQTVAASVNEDDDDDHDHDVFPWNFFPHPDP